ncbi:MAG: 7tm chemosensory receptor/ankyrin repeat domain-containing protein, partial [Edafosvirus sp.]
MVVYILFETLFMLCIGNSPKENFDVTCESACALPNTQMGGISYSPQNSPQNIMQNTYVPVVQNTQPNFAQPTQPNFAQPIQPAPINTDVQSIPPEKCVDANVSLPEGLPNRGGTGIYTWKRTCTGDLHGTLTPVPEVNGSNTECVNKEKPKERLRDNRPGTDCGKNEVITNEMKFSDYNFLPLAEGYSSRDYEYGYSYLPPDKWFPIPPFPPVCVTETKCPVCPMNTSGTPVDMKEWDSSRRVTQPDNIRADYIE